MNKKIAKSMATAAMIFAISQTFSACGDDSSSASNEDPKNDSEEVCVDKGIIKDASGIDGITTLGWSYNAVINDCEVSPHWAYFMSTDENAVKWGPFSDDSPVTESDPYTPNESIEVNTEIIKQCNGVCGKATIQASDSENDNWNPLQISAEFTPDLKQGMDVSSWKGICLKYQAEFVGEVFDKFSLSNSTFLRIQLQTGTDYTDNSFDYASQYQYLSYYDEFSNSEVKVLNLLWSDFEIDSYLPEDKKITMEQAIQHLVAVKALFIHWIEDEELTVKFNIQKIGAYGTCEE